MKNMGKVILGVTISLDGFAEDSNGTLRNTEVMREAIQNTGAVVMEWKEFAMAEDPDWFAGNYEFQVAIFVFTHKVPEKHPKETDTLTFTFVTDGIENAIRQAKAAAGQKDITIIGSASTAQQCLKAGLADELDSHKRLTFNRMINLAIDGLIDEPEVLEHVKYLIVDEYQDINRAQEKLIRLIGKNHHIFIVGDPRQTIYQWRGADERCFEDFTTYYLDTETVPITENRRSTKSILEIANDFSDNFKIHYCPVKAKLSDETEIILPIHLGYLMLIDT